MISEYANDAMAPARNLSEQSGSHGSDIAPIAAFSDTFYRRFEVLARQRSAFCFGIDPSIALLQHWGLPLNIDGLRRFCDIALAAARDHVAIIKPQAAFFEVFGPEGLLVLRECIQNARAAGHLVIADVKRADVTHSAAAYAQAWLGPDSPFGADAMTTTGWFGEGTLKPLLDRAVKCGGAVFLVVRASNPESALIQESQIDGEALADVLARRIEAINRDHHGDAVGPVGAVIGATLSPAVRRTIDLMPNALFLTPGLGAQGAGFDDLLKLFGGAINRVIPTSSRGVLVSGPDHNRLRDALAFHVDATFAVCKQAC